MTTYSTIADGQIDQDSPVTQPLLTALRDNPIAITEGASGAPRIAGLAVATVEELPVMSVTAADTYDVGFGVTTNSILGSTSSLTYVDAYVVDVVNASGSIRFKASHRTVGLAPDASFLRILKNDVEVAEWSTTSQTMQPRSADISVSVGDEIKWQLKTNDATAASQITDEAETASDGWTTRSLYIKRTDL